MEKRMGEKKIVFSRKIGEDKKECHYYKYVTQW